MQNKYFGDKHDFYKYYFLKHISQYYTIGIHWYLVPDELRKNDGNKPLTKKEEDKCSDLYSILLHSEKNVKNIEKYFSNETKFYDEKHEKYIYDYIYEKKSIEKLMDRDIVFLDPDNGIEMPSTQNKNKFKYVSYRLLSKFWEMGNSLIIYQHSDMAKDSIEKKVENLCEVLNCSQEDIIIIKKGNVKYVVIINKKHLKLHSVMKNFLEKNIEYEKYL